MSEPMIVKTIFLNASAEKVWRYLTEKDLLARWFHETDGDLDAGAASSYASFDIDKCDRTLKWGEVHHSDVAPKLVLTVTCE